MHQTFNTHSMTLLSDTSKAVLGSPELWKIDAVLYPQMLKDRS
ncbi:unnamed protein product [Acanthoscelides obtectus]|uniref:Uncharacterized protein n=1 Tax=Acanthoscelides obtectus TaxID=200917 RepID=A0A9P0PEX3_ACAOB|nr:unnamed protein product [Acanthoscelides obtectus]CAK1678231.1 hypothetical protein AOBTE_LOCUS31791 [Acanthoscelides obtectus]